MNSFLEEKKCVICNSDQYKILYKWPKNFYDKNKFETSSWDGRESIRLQIVKCAKCDLVYSRPSFKEAYLYKIYPRDIIKKQKSLMFKLYDGKVNSLLKICIKYLPKKSVIFDIGTRYGVLPYIAQKKYGLIAYGIEFNPESVKIGKQKFKNIYEGTIDDLPRIVKNLDLKNVDAFIMDDVLEHLANPDKNLKILFRLQKKGCYLFLRQMDYNSLGRIFYGKEWYYFQPAAHMYYFSEDSIGNILKKNGYEIVKIYRKNLAINLFMTFLMKVKHMINNPRDMIKDNKPLYLVNRKKSYDDMFLVIARKM